MNAWPTALPLPPGGDARCACGCPGEWIYCRVFVRTACDACARRLGWPLPTTTPKD